MESRRVFLYRWVGVCAATAALAAVGLLAGLACFRLRLPPPPKVGASLPGAPVPTDTFTGDELAVYSAVLHDLTAGQNGRLLLSTETESSGRLDGGSGPECATAASIESKVPAFIHRFQPETLAIIGLATVKLVDRRRIDEERSKVYSNGAKRSDPSAHPEVSEAILHGYFSLGEVQFDPSHTHAILDFEFRCPMCGHGEIDNLVKTGGKWKVTGNCMTWIS